MGRLVPGLLTVPQALGLLVTGWGLMAVLVQLGAWLRGLAQGLDHAEALRRVTSEPLGPALAELVALGVVTVAGAWLAAPEAPLRRTLQIAPLGRDVAALAMIAGAASHAPAVALAAWLGDRVPALARDADDVLRVTAMTRIDSPLRAITVPLALVVLAPAAEELLFRGLFVPAFRARFRAHGAVVLSAVLFGAFHLDPAVALVGALVGLALGALVVRTGSVLASAAFHGAFNAVPILAPPGDSPWASLRGVPGAHVPGWLVVGSLALAGLAALGLASRTRPR